jgi:hypothetical protein
LATEQRFLALGDGAKEFARGLAEHRSGAAGYHMGQILHLADRAGVEPVVEALRHAARYDAFDYRAVERIVTGRGRSARVDVARAREVAALTPQQIDKYLKGAGSHQRALDRYQQSVRPMRPDPTPDVGEEEDNGE